MQIGDLLGRRIYKGCLFGVEVEVEGLNEDGKKVKYRATELLCRAFCHEIDHLDGIMYVDRAYEVYEEEE